MLRSILYIMWHIHRQGLMLLHLTVKEEMHLQEITLFDLGQGHTKSCPVPSTSCDLSRYNGVVVLYSRDTVITKTTKGLNGENVFS